MAKRRYWLMKSEPESFSIDDLQRLETTSWDGVRNYQARNYMRDDMRKGDLVLFYHSNAKPPGVVGVARVCKTAYPDHTAWDLSDHHYDPKASPENPIWMMVDVEFVERFDDIVSLTDWKANPRLEGMLVTRRGMRLSVQPVEKEHFDEVRKMAKRA